MDHHDRDRDRRYAISYDTIIDPKSRIQYARRFQPMLILASFVRRGQDRPLGGDTFRPREQGVARGDGFRSGHGRSPPTSNDTYKPFNERGTRPRSRSPGFFRRRSRSPPQMRSRGGIIPADTWRAGQDPEPTGPAGRRSPRRWSPRRDDHVSGRSRSPTRGPRMRSRSPLGADLRSPRDGRDRYSAAHKRSRELSYDRGFVRGARSPLPASREWRASPGSRRSPPTGPRSASQWRQRSRSPYRSDHRPPRSRPRSPVSPPRAPRVDHQKTSESSSINTSRRSSPPMHPSRAAVMHSDAPTGPSHGRPALRSPHRVPSTGTSGAPNRRSSPRRERTPIPTSRARQYSPQPDVIPRGPAASGYRRDTNVHTSRDQPMNDVPQASHSYHSNESSNSRNQEISSRDRTNPHLTNVQASSILSAPTQPRGSFRGSLRGSPFPHPGRGGSGGNGYQPHLRSRPHSPSPLSDSVAIQKSTPITPTTSTGPPMVPTGGVAGDDSLGAPRVGSGGDQAGVGVGKVERVVSGRGGGGDYF